MDAYFERVDADRYRPTVHTGGAWNADEIHFSPLGGLIVHAIDLHRAARAAGAGGRDEASGGSASTASATDRKRLARVSFDILGFLASDDCTVTVETIRPGRTIELVEATVSIRGRSVALARAWFVDSVDTTTVAGGQPATLDTPESVGRWSMHDIWPGGYVKSLDVRPLQSPQPGRATVWLTTSARLVAGETASPHASFIALVDTANGIAIRQSIHEWAFPNLDLTIHLFRQPTGAWTGLDTSVVFGPAGHGLTSSVLHDLDGPVGHAEQILTIRPLG